jgi:hypothetical protein
MLTRRIVVILLFVVVASAASPAGGVPWDKAPEQWTLADAFRILQDSPWSPSKFSLEANYQQRRTDPQTEVVGDSRVQAKSTAVVPGVTYRGATRCRPLRCCGGPRRRFDWRKRRGWHRALALRSRTEKLQLPRCRITF